MRAYSAVRGAATGAEDGGTVAPCLAVDDVGCSAPEHSAERDSSRRKAGARGAGNVSGTFVQDN